jgi:hypothetical protein
MPSVNVVIGQGGPIAQVVFGVSIPKQGALKAAGMVVPQPVTGNFLIDTGASGTCVDATLIAKLGLTPTGSINIHTPSTNGASHVCNQYDAMIFIPGAANVGGFLIDALPILEANLIPQGIDGLIGRDILDRCTLIYNGSLKVCTIAY